jgi:hypothetical protein
MKKIIILACASLLIMASCGNKTKSNAEGVDSVSDSTAVVSQDVQTLVSDITTKLNSTDPAQVQSALENVRDNYAELVENGNVEEAKEYASAIQKFVSENSEKLSKVAKGETTVIGLINGIKNLPTSAEATAEEAAAAVKADAAAAANAAEEATKAAAAEKVNEATAPVAEKVNEAKKNADAAAQKVNEKAEQANATVDAAKKLLGK